MISSQLKRKKLKFYGPSTDLEIESLLDLIDFVQPSKYTSQSSIHFDRLRLTKQQEFKFNKKFRMWLKSLVLYNTHINYKFLLDFLIRKYYINVYNQEELIFLTLVNKEYYTNNLEIFPFLNQCRVFNSSFIVDCCYKNYKFLDLIFDYLNYIDYFVDELLVKYHLKYKFCNSQLETIKNKNLQIYNLIMDTEKKFNNDIYNKKHEIKILKNIDSLFEIYKNKKGRDLFSNYNKLIEYIKYLKFKNLEDVVITKDELNVLNAVIYNHEIIINDLESVQNLLFSLDYKYDIFKTLYTKFRNIIFYDSKIYDFYDKESILQIIDENNFKDVKLQDKDILKKCLCFSNFDPDIFRDVILEKNLIFEDKIAEKNYKTFYLQRNYLNEKYTSLKEFKINPEVINYEVILENYDKTLRPEIKDEKLIYFLCNKIGYNEILDKYDLKEIKLLSEHNLKVLEYCLNKYELTHIFDLLVIYYKELIFFNQNHQFKKLKVFIKELTKDKESCLYIFDVIFQNVDKYKEDLDLIEIYDKKFNFINNFKEKILQNIEIIPINIFDWLIKNTEYDDIRIINKISKKIIEQRFSSINLLFKKYGNIMLPYLDLYVQFYNVYDVTAIFNLNCSRVFDCILKYNKFEEFEEYIIKILKTKVCDSNQLMMLLEKSNNKEIIFETLNYLYKTEYVKSDFDIYIYKLFDLDKELCLRFSKFYTQEVKNKLFNIILEEENFSLINNFFSIFKLKDENIIYKILELYYKDEVNADCVSYISCNITDIHKFNDKIFSNLDNNKLKTLNLIYSLMQNNEKYKIFFKKIHEEIIILINSRDEHIKNISKKIYEILNCD